MDRILKALAATLAMLVFFAGVAAFILFSPQWLFLTVTITTLVVVTFISFYDAFKY